MSHTNVLLSQCIWKLYLLYVVVCWVYDSIMSKTAMYTPELDSIAEKNATIWAFSKS